MVQPLHTGIEGSGLLRRAAEVLGDYDPATPHVRWTRTELIGYLNEAITEVRARRPEAFVLTTDLALQPGDIQRLPKDFASLINVEASYNGHRRSPVTKADYKYARLFTKQVRSADFDGDPLADYQVRTFTPHPVDDTIFYVDPPFPVGCSARIVATLVFRPKRLDDTDMHRDLPVKPEIEPALLEWMLYRAFTKDQESATAREQGVMHKKSFDDMFKSKEEVQARVDDGREGDVRGSIDAQRTLRKGGGGQ